MNKDIEQTLVKLKRLTKEIRISTQEHIILLANIRSNLVNGVITLNEYSKIKSDIEL